PVPPQAGEAALEENKSMVELMRNASTRVLNFLNDNQQIFIAASFSVGTLFPLIGIIGMIHKTLVTINVITFVKNNYAAALELIKKHPYRFAAMLVATVALTFFLRSEMWSGKATTTTPPPPPTTTTPPIFSKAPSVNGDFPSVPFAIRDIITGSTPTPVVKYVPTPTPINLFDRYNKTFGMII
ncbi:MAG: hypothetical protein LBB17_02015, partial [Puniceicoccales bacterium]|nr:hypothetical protein [Puniceicoccales bacterium]